MLNRRDYTVWVKENRTLSYAVIELPIENQFESIVYAVPACTAWLEDITVKISAKDGKQITFAALCKWPPEESKLSDYLEKKKKPTANWLTFENIKILKFCKSARQAKEEVEKALNVSDLSQSDKDKNIKRQRLVTKRYSPPLIVTSNRKKHTIVYSTDSDSNSELQAPTVRNLKINANNKNKTTSLLSHMNDSDDTLSDNCTQQTRNASVFKSQESQISDAICLTYSSIDETINDENINPNLPKKRKCNVLKDLQTNKQDNVVREYDNSDDRSFCKANQQAQDRRTFPVNERSIMAAISDLRNSIDNLRITVKQIYIATCHPTETLDNSFGIPSLPLTSMEDFRIWEDFILDEEKKLIMIRLFIEHCTEDLKGSTYCIMRKLMTNKVAVNFNLKGTNREGARVEKKKFQSTISYGFIIATLRRHAQEKTDRGFHFIYNKEMADLHVANWLKDARKRLENDELRLQKNRQQDDREEDN